MQLVACPRCATSLSHDPYIDGNSLMCPMCGQPFLASVAQYPPPPVATPAPPRQKNQSSGWAVARLAIFIAALSLITAGAAGWWITRDRTTVILSLPKSSSDGKVVFEHKGWGDGKTPVFKVGDHWSDYIKLAGEAIVRQYKPDGKLVHTYHPSTGILGGSRYGGYNDKGGEFYFEIDYYSGTGPWTVTIEQH